MSTRAKWGRWVSSLPCWRPEWCGARRRWLARDHARRLLPHLGLDARATANYLRAHDLPAVGPVP